MPFLIGIIISDGWLTINKNGNARLSFKQSMKHLNFFLIVYSKLNFYCSKGPFLTKTTLQTRDKKKIHYGIQFTTRTLPCFTPLYHQFYKNGKKIVPSILRDYISLELLSYWICGNGAYKSGVVLNTQSFTVKEAILICDILYFDLNLLCRVHFNRGQPIVYIKAKSLKKVKNELLRYIPDSLKYKVGYIKV